YRTLAGTSATGSTLARPREELSKAALRVVLERGFADPSGLGAAWGLCRNDRVLRCYRREHNPSDHDRLSCTDSRRPRSGVAAFRNDQVLGEADFRRWRTRSLHVVFDSSRFVFPRRGP